MLFVTALVIFDETQTGLGRTGEHFWGFQNYGNIVPDILTCGRPLGAGHPIGACITSSRVARRFVQIFVFLKSRIVESIPALVEVQLIIFKYLQKEKCLFFLKR